MQVGKLSKHATSEFEKVGRSRVTAVLFEDNKRGRTIQRITAHLR